MMVAEDKEKTPEKLIKVTILNANETNALVEYGDGERVYIPNKHIQGGLVKEYILERGVHYGIDFKGMDLKVTPESVEKILHKRGIWTKEDVMTKPNIVIAALQEAFGLTLSNILQFIERNEK